MVKIVAQIADVRCVADGDILLCNECVEEYEDGHGNPLCESCHRYFIVEKEGFTCPECDELIYDEDDECPPPFSFAAHSLLLNLKNQIDI